MERIGLALCGSLLVVAHTACSDPPSAPDPADLTTRTRAIYNGAQVWSPEIVDLTPGQALAVGAVMEGSGLWGSFDNLCTGTLVAPDVVLTAAHCVLVEPSKALEPDQVRLHVGPIVDAPSSTHYVAAVHVHPDYDYWSDTAVNDVAILRLEQPATALEPTVEPLPVHCGSLAAEGFVGQRLQTVGYGATDLYGNVDGEDQRWAVEEVVSMSSTEFVVDGYGESGTCYGDSGGPALWTMPDGVVRILGVLSLGDELCGHQDAFVRTDAECGFITGFLPACAPDECGGLCGTCPEGETCQAGGCVAAPPVPEPDPDVTADAATGSDVAADADVPRTDGPTAGDGAASDLTSAPRSLDPTRSAGGCAATDGGTDGAAYLLALIFLAGLAGRDRARRDAAATARTGMVAAIRSTSGRVRSRSRG